MLKHVMLGVVLSMFAASAVYAKDEPAAAPAAKKERTPQQQKMADCNKTAGEKQLKGDDRKKFMKECLSKKPEKSEDKKTAQQSKMKDCNKEAGEKKLKGNDRKKFMSECLKAK